MSSAVRINCRSVGSAPFNQGLFAILRFWIEQCNIYRVLSVLLIICLCGFTPAIAAPYCEVAARGCGPKALASSHERDGQKDDISTDMNATSKKPGLYFACERRLSLKGKRISASDWLGKTSKDLSFGDRSPTHDELYSEDELFQRISAEVEHSGRPLTIFVHGCCVSFSEDLIQANDIHQALQTAGLNGPLLAYDWATPCYNYPGSLAKLPGCRTNFTAFLDRLVAKLGREKIVIVAHSLGIHALQDYCLHALQKEPQGGAVFSAVILSRPDVDVSSFKNSEAAVKNFSGKLMLLCAANDINLKLSSFIRRAGYNFVEDPRPVAGNHLRLGQASVASGLAESFSVYDISHLRLRHLIPYKLIAGLLTGETSDYSIEKADGGVLQVKNR